MEALGWASVNGQLSLFKDVQIPAGDRGFLYGDQIIETMLAIDTRVISVERHLDRLLTSLKVVHMDLGVSKAELMAECQRVVQISGYKRSMVRMMITRGLSVGIFASIPQSAQRYIFVWPVPDTYAGEDASSARHNCHDAPGLRCEFVVRDTDYYHTLKTGFYLPAIAEIHAQATSESGLNELVWVRDDGEILEAATANLFLLKAPGAHQRPSLWTPNHESVFSGLTRDMVMDIAGELGIEVKMTKIYRHEIQQFSECFLASSVSGLRQVHHLATHSFDRLEDSLFGQIKDVYEHKIRRRAH